MRVERIRNRYARRFVIVSLFAVWAFTMAGLGIGMIIEEMYWGARLAVGTFRREWDSDVECFRRNLRKIW